MGKSINAKKYDTQPLENPREKKNNGGKSQRLSESTISKMGRKEKANLTRVFTFK